MPHKKQLAGFLDRFEGTKAFRDMEALIQKALLEQWETALYSGLINKLYKNYHRFYKRDYNKVKKKVEKQEGESLDTLSEAEELELIELQEDKFVLDKKNIKLGSLHAFIATEVASSLPSILSKQKFSPNMKNYLRVVGNSAGQEIINSIPTSRTIKFRLSNKEIKDKLAKRVDMLARGLDEATKKSLTTTLYNGVLNKERRVDLIKKVQEKGLGISESRARRIIMTETEAAGEYVRWQTANWNGVRVKKWVTVWDSKVCELCAELSDVEIPINENFKVAGFEVKEPPLHSYCRCSVEYDPASSLCAEYVIQKKVTLSEKVDALFQKFFKAKDDLYSTPNTGSERCVNPENVWAGGESNVGKDKGLGNWEERIKNADSEDAKSELLKQAGRELSADAMVQLKLKLGHSVASPSMSDIIPFKGKLSNEIKDDISNAFIFKRDIVSGELTIDSTEVERELHRLLQKHGLSKDWENIIKKPLAEYTSEWTNKSYKHLLEVIEKKPEVFEFYKEYQKYVLQDNPLAGESKIVLFRGVSPDANMDYTGKLTSWTRDRRVAQKFAEKYEGKVIKGTFDIQDIVFDTTISGSGSFGESEVLVMLTKKTNF